MCGELNEKQALVEASCIVTHLAVLLVFVDPVVAPANRGNKV
jgi:hypothetical protein